MPALRHPPPVLVTGIGSSIGTGIVGDLRQLSRLKPIIIPWLGEKYHLLTRYSGLTGGCLVLSVVTDVLITVSMVWTLVRLAWLRPLLSVFADASMLSAESKQVLTLRRMTLLTKSFGVRTNLGFVEIPHPLITFWT